MLHSSPGGSAPKHVEQFVQEGHLRWDSLGEYLATAIGFEELSMRTGNKNAKVLGETLMEAVSGVLNHRKSPGRKVKEPDNRATNFYIAKYWAEAMARHVAGFGELSRGLAEAEAQILQELLDCQGPPVDLGGYYKPDPEKTQAAMRPSAAFNALIDGTSAAL